MKNSLIADWDNPVDDEPKYKRRAAPKPGKVIACVPTDQLEGSERAAWRDYGFWSFIFEEEAALKAKLRVPGVKLIENSDGWLDDLAAHSHDWLNEWHRFDQWRALARLDRETEKKLLSLLTRETWTTEEEIAKHVSLRPFQWKGLATNGRITARLRKGEFVYKLSAYAQREREAAELVL